MTGMDRFITSRTTRQISYDEFLDMLDNGRVEAVMIGGDRLEIALNDEPLMTYYTAYLPDTQLVDRLEDAGVTYYGSTDSGGSAILNFLVVYILPFVS